MTALPDLSQLAHEEQDALIRALWAQVQALTAQVQALTARVAELEARLGAPPKTPDNSSLPPSQGKKPSRAAKMARRGPRSGSLGRMGADGHWLRTLTRSSLPGRCGARTVRWRLVRRTKCCIVATTRSTCPRWHLW